MTARVKPSVGPDFPVPAKSVCCAVVMSTAAPNVTGRLSIRPMTAAANARVSSV